MRSKFAVRQAWKFTVSATGFRRSECLVEKGSNPLGAPSRIESVDSQSHEVKR